MNHRIDRQRIHTLAVLALVYLASLGILFYAHTKRITKDVALNGEELACAYRNVYFLPQRVQCDSYATTFSSTIFYWIGSYVIPISVNSQRVFKILWMALLPPILVLVLRAIRPATSLEASAAACLLFLAVPVVSWFSVMAVECPADCPFGFLALLLAVRFSWADRRAKVAASLATQAVLIVWFLHFYGGSMSLAVTIPILIGWKGLWQAPGRIKRSLAWWVLFCGGIPLMALWPKLYYSPMVVMFGGGRRLTLDGPAIRESLRVVFDDLFGKPSSYLVDGEVFYPVFPGLWYQLLFGALAVLGGYLLIREKNRYFSWLLVVAGLTLTAGSLFGAVPGIRRLVPLLIVAFLFLGYGLDMAGSMGKGRGVWLRRSLIAVLAVYSAGIYEKNYSSVLSRYRSLVHRELSLLDGEDYEGTIEGLIDELQMKPIRFRSELKARLQGSSELEGFVASHQYLDSYIPSKYERYSDDPLLLRGEMSGEEKVDLYAIFGDQASRAEIDRLYELSQGHVFHHRDTVTMIKLMCNRRGLSTKNIEWTD